MPITRYIGRPLSFEGKSLFDILYRLKNFGVGRIVYRNIFAKRYEEPSYYIITKVYPDTKNTIVSINRKCLEKVSLTALKQASAN